MRIWPIFLLSLWWCILLLPTNAMQHDLQKTCTTLADDDRVSHGTVSQTSMFWVLPSQRRKEQHLSSACRWSSSSWPCAGKPSCYSGRVRTWWIRECTQAALRHVHMSRLSLTWWSRSGNNSMHGLTVVLIISWSSCWISPFFFTFSMTPLRHVVPFDHMVSIHTFCAAWFVVASLVHSFAHFYNFYQLVSEIPPMHACMWMRPCMRMWPTCGNMQLTLHPYT